MRALLLLLSLSASAGPAGPVTGAARPTGFPGAFVGSVALSLQTQPLYGGMLLDSLDLHLRSVVSMRSPQAVSNYLVDAVAGTVAEPKEAAARLRESLGREPLPAPRAAALLLANALSRPDQFEEILNGLETERAGLGKHAAGLLAGVEGGGDRRLIDRLNAVARASSPARTTRATVAPASSRRCSTAHPFLARPTPTSRRSRHPISPATAPTGARAAPVSRPLPSSTSSFPDYRRGPFRDIMSFTGL